MALAARDLGQPEEARRLLEEAHRIEQLDRPRRAGARARTGDVERVEKALVERAIRNSSKPRDTVLDCFGGSGTTMIAAERTGRRSVLLELDPCYADVIVRRWQEATSEVAVLDGEDRSFADVAQARRADAA
jgi:predicted RNA methylase